MMTISIRKYIRKKFVNFFVCLLIVSNLFCSGSLYAVEPAEIIDHMVGIYISKRGLNPIEHNLDQVLELNGFATTDYYLDLYSKRTGRTPLKELLPENKKIQRVARTIRYYFTKFFQGIYIRSVHDLEVELKGIGVTAEWKKFGLVPSIDYTNELSNNESILVNLEFVAKNLKIFIDNVTARDHLHKFIGDVGMDGLYVELDPTSVPLKVSVPIKLILLEDGSLKVEVKDTVTNLMEVTFKSGFRAPMKLPRVQIEINGRKAWLRLREVERVLKSKMSTLVNGIKESIQKFIDESAVPMVSESLNRYLGKKYTEINEMDPVGVPEGKIARRYLWGLSLGNMGFLGDNLHIGLHGFVTDNTVSEALPIEKKLMAINPPKEATFLGIDYDLALSLNQGFINRLLQLGDKRGYFRNIEVKSGESLKLVKRPFIIFRKENGRLNIRTKYTVKGWQKIFVRNPMEIELDLLINFKQNESGALQMIVEQVDLNSINVEKKYIRVFKKKVRKVIRKKLAVMNKELSGYVLSENLPMPDSIGSVPVEVIKSRLDDNGHLIVFLKYNL